MKKWIFCVLLTFGATVTAQEAVDESKMLDANERAFAGLTVNNAGFKYNAKFNVVTQSHQAVSTDSTKMAVKVWFSDSKGRPYAPDTHRFNPNEKFDIWVLATCPVVVALFQNYPEDRPASRLVYPVEKNPATYAVIQPGKPVKIPVSFAMDDDMRDEIMSIVVAMADINTEAAETAIQNNQSVQIIAEESSQIVIHQTNETTQIQENQNHSPGATQEASVDKPRRIVKFLGDFDSKCAEAKTTSVKFNPCYGNVVPECNNDSSVPTNENEKVCLILFGECKLAQYQITMHK